MLPNKQETTEPQPQTRSTKGRTPTGIRRPIPLYWGLVALALFAAFAIITQVEFNRGNSKVNAQTRAFAVTEINTAKDNQYRAELRTYDLEVAANTNCVSAVATRFTYRTIFNGVETLFNSSGDFLVDLFNNAPQAIAYQQFLSTNVKELLTDVVDSNLPIKDAKDCPPVPSKPINPVTGLPDDGTGPSQPPETTIPAPTTQGS